jgi:Rad3-related DNA helicase
VLLDPRVYTKRYGRLFVDSLPDCELVEEFATSGEAIGGDGSHSQFEF